MTGVGATTTGGLCDRQISQERAGSAISPGQVEQKKLHWKVFGNRAGVENICGNDDMDTGMSSNKNGVESF